MTRNKYKKSQELFERAQRVIPLASQTFSKSYLQYPKGFSPLFLQRGLGSRVWDVDDNEYVDLVNGLLPVVLGYADPDVDLAIQNQLKNGISFSLPTELECQLAERLSQLIPCAEMVRYGKNGTDVTSAAIRLARAHTKRDRIAVCGYHGWQDWYVGSTVRHLGVPQVVRDLTHRFEYNQIDSLQKLLTQYPGEFAAVMMEPVNTTLPQPGFLQSVKALAHQHGALFILDEIITGFRLHLGGAQTLFNVVPDLATFGKSLGNGMPISVIVGRADVMRLMEDIFYSGTFGGETLSLAAAIAVIDKMSREKVIEKLWHTGQQIVDLVQREIDSAELGDVFSFSGLAPWKFININHHKNARKEAIKTLLMREMIDQGVLVQSTHNVSYAHGKADIDKIVSAYRHSLAACRAALDTGTLEADLQCQVLEPIFKLR